MPAGQGKINWLHNYFYTTLGRSDPDRDGLDGSAGCWRIWNVIKIRLLQEIFDSFA